MKESLRSFFSGVILLGSGLMSGSAIADPPFPVLLARYNGEITKNASDYSRRVDRAYLILEHGEFRDTAGDIDTLLSHPRWRSEGERLQAIRLHHQGHFDEARILIRENIRGAVHVQEQSRLLADIELSRKDTAAAITAYHSAWAHDSDETDYLDLLDLYRGRHESPEVLLQQGLRHYPRSPGAIQVIFEVYFEAGGSTHLRKCLEISARAEEKLWPLSVDWKVRHARVLMAMGRRQNAESVLRQALDLMDGDPRLQTNTGDAPLLRKQIFALLEECRK